MSKQRTKLTLAMDHQDRRQSLKSSDSLRSGLDGNDGHTRISRVKRRTSVRLVRFVREGACRPPRVTPSRRAWAAAVVLVATIPSTTPGPRTEPAGDHDGVPGTGNRPRWIADDPGSITLG